MQNLPRHLFVTVSVLLMTVCVCMSSRAYGQEVEPITVDEMNRMLAADEPHLISLMTSWCGPCKEELRMLNELHEEFSGQGLAFAGLSLDIAPEQMEKVLQSVPADFPFYWVGEAGMEELEVYAVPQLYLVQGGGVFRKLVGLQEKAELRELIVEMLEQGE